MIMTMDIGGTKTLCAFWQEGRLIKSEKIATASIADFDQLLSRFAKEYEVDCLCIAAAGPVRGPEIVLTNTGQRINTCELCRHFPRIPEILLLNDLEAVGYSLAALKQAQLYTLRRGTPVDGAKAVVSIGTGLGIGAVTKKGEVFPSEGGHMDFAPQNQQQMELLHVLSQRYGHVSYERLLSGQGLANIYAFLTGLSLNSGAQVTEKAAQKEPAALQTMTLFSQILGAACASYGLVFMADAGIYLGGGIAPKILPFLDRPAFETAFLDKGRFADRLKQIPVYVILDETAPSLGAAIHAEQLSSAFRSPGLDLSRQSPIQL